MDGQQFDRVARRVAGSARSRRTLLTVAAAAVASRLLAPIPAAVEDEVLDARCPAPGGELQRFQRQVVAQSFKAKHGGALVRSKVWFTEAGAGGTDNFWVSIHTTDSKGGPAARVLAEAQVSNVSNPPAGQTTEATADFTVSALGPARVKKGKQYALVVRGAGSDHPSLQLNLNGGCKGSVFGFNDLTGKWERGFGDLVFETSVKRS